MTARAIVRANGDLLLALALAGIGLAELVTDDDLSSSQRLGVVAGLAVLSVGLLARQRHPLLLLTIVFVGAVTEPFSGDVAGVDVFGLFALLAVYTAAAHASARLMWVAGAMTFTLAWIVMLTDPEGVTFGAMLFFGLLFGVPWVAGRAIRHRRLREHQLALEKAAAEAAIAEERSRIARELHDVVAHAISVIVLQARGGRRVLDSDPETARGTFDTIERTSQQALDEMRRLLGLLRPDDETLALAPQPSLDRLDALVAGVRSAGLPVDLVVEGTARDIPYGVDLSAYRIVQEALTNALKHAGPAQARVAVRYLPGEIDLEIVDDGCGVEPGPPSTGMHGHGLAGIRERVTIFGGELNAGPGSHGGYAVRARLPYAVDR